MQELAARHLFAGLSGVAGLHEAFEDQAYVYSMLELATPSQLVPCMPLEHVIVQRMRQASMLVMDTACCFALGV